MLVCRADTKVDLSYSEGARLIEECDTRCHMGVIDVNQCVRSARKRKGLFELCERDMTL